MTASRSRQLWRSIVRHRVLLLMVLPAFLYFLIFRHGPILGVSIAFLDFRAKVGQTFFQSIARSRWVGLQNFRDFLTSMTGLQILRNTLLISLYKIVFGFPAPIILALLLNEVQASSFKRVVQTITYLLHFISWVILAGILRMLLSPDFGLIVPLFRWFGVEVINLLGDVREMSESPYCPLWVPEVYEKYLDPLAVEYAHHNPGYFDALLSIPFAEQTKYGPDLDKLTNETFLAIITGKKPISEYDSYVQTWMKNGGEEMTKAAQALYDRAFK